MKSTGKAESAFEDSGYAVGEGRSRILPTSAAKPPHHINLL